MRRIFSIIVGGNGGETTRVSIYNRSGLVGGIDIPLSVLKVYGLTGARKIKIRISSCTNRTTFHKLLYVTFDHWDGAISCPDVNWSVLACGPALRKIFGNSGTFRIETLV